MTKILKFNNYNRQTELTNRFIESILNPPLLESTETEEGIISILKNLQKDLKFNIKLIFTFGTGIASMYPIVLNLIKNQNLKIDTTPENVVLLTLTSVVILALEIQKDDQISKDEVKFLLNELKLRGIGNGIVKKMVNSFKSIGNLLTILFKNTSTTVRHLIDMFGYTSILIPTMNALSSIVADYNWTMDTIIGNLSSLGVGILTFLAKNGWDYLKKRLKNKTKINPELDNMKIKGKEELDYGQDFFPTDDKLIKEQ
jgi:hypothetical protein